MDSSTAIARCSSVEESEEDLVFPETEACKLFGQCKWIAYFYPGIDAEILIYKKYKE
jgi:hypothetical protein